MDHYVYMVRFHTDLGEAFQIVGHGEYASLDNAKRYLEENPESFILQAKKVPKLISSKEFFVLNYDKPKQMEVISLR